MTIEAAIQKQVNACRARFKNSLIRRAGEPQNKDQSRPDIAVVWQVKRQFKGKYGNSGGNSRAIQGNSDLKTAIQASGGVPKPEKCGNSRPWQFAFIKLNNIYGRKGSAVSTQCGAVSTQSQGSAVSTQCGAVSTQSRVLEFYHGHRFF